MDEQEGKIEMERIDELVKAFGPYDPKLGAASYKYPPAEMFGSAGFRKFFSDHPSADAALKLSVYLGDGQYAFFQDLTLTANILAAGAIGSGKTQFIYNQIVIWLLKKHPAELKFVLCGSKPVDYFPFRKLSKHFLAAIGDKEPIITPESFEWNLKGLLRECARRLELFKLAGVRNLAGYNDKFVRRQIGNPEQHRYLPEIVLVIDDLFNFLTDQTTNDLCTLMQMNTGTGIYILAVTSQIASHKFTKQLRSNFTFHAALKLMSQAESRIILNKPGAEKLRMPGELFFDFNGRPAKAEQFMTDFADIERMLEFIAGQRGYPSVLLLPEDAHERELVYDPGAKDPLFEESARLVVLHQQGSTSLVQRKLKLGYNRAGRIIEQLCAAGIIGPFEGSKAREVLYPDEYSLERYLKQLNGTAGHPEPPDTAPETVQPPVTAGQSPEPAIPPSPKLVESTPAPKPGFWASLFGGK